MKTGFRIIIMFLMLITAAIQATEKTKSKLKIATTIDFLDYVFYDHIGKKEYFTLDSYERRIKEMAAGGIKKIYLRVNANGLTLYPSKLSKQFGTDGDYFWTDPRGSFRLIETLKRYDPLKETIRLGHKYGMEVWCWESLCDDSAKRMTPPKNEKRTCLRPLLDPYFRKHPEGYAMLDPRLYISDKKLALINSEAKKFPIKKIIIQNAIKGRPAVRIKKEDIEILTSMDNKKYRSYKGGFTFSKGKTSAGCNYMVLDDLSIRANFVKLQLKKSFPGNDRISGYTIAANAARGLCKVYNTKGKLISSVWSTIINSRNKVNVSFNFKVFLPAGFDSFGNKRQVGFKIGEVARERYFYGVAEFNVPATMKYKVARFKELTNYPFDGFMFNLRTHSYNASPENYGYNPEVRKKFLRRYGKDIYKDKFDKSLLFKIRAEAIAEFLKLCKKETAGRPLYISGVAKAVPWKKARSHYSKKYGPLPWLYNRYVKEGSIDGIMLMGCDDIASIGLSPKLAAKIKLGIFREMGFPPRGYDFAKDIAKLKQRKDIDEVELYETMILTNRPKMFEIIKGNK